VVRAHALAASGGLYKPSVQRHMAVGSVALTQAREAAMMRIEHTAHACNLCCKRCLHQATGTHPREIRLPISVGTGPDVSTASRRWRRRRDVSRGGSATIGGRRHIGGFGGFSVRDDLHPVLLEDRLNRRRSALLQCLL